MRVDHACRVCEFVAALGSADAPAAQLLISSGMLSKLRIPLGDFVNARLTPAEQRTEWDEEDAHVDDSFPSMPAMEAVLDALEVRENHHTKVSAQQAHEMGWKSLLVHLSLAKSLLLTLQHLGAD